MKNKADIFTNIIYSRDKQIDTLKYEVSKLLRVISDQAIKIYELEQGEANLMLRIDELKEDKNNER